MTTLNKSPFHTSCSCLGQFGCVYMTRCEPGRQQRLETLQAQAQAGQALLAEVQV